MGSSPSRCPGLYNSTITQSPVASPLCWAAAKRKKRAFSIFGVYAGSWWIEVKRPEGALLSQGLFTAETLVSTSLCQPAVPKVTFAAAIADGKAWLGLTAVGVNVKRGIRVGWRGHGPEGKQTEEEEENNSTETIKEFHSGTNVTAERGRRGPRRWARDSSSVKKIPDGCNVTTGRVSGLRPFTNHSPALMWARRSVLC